MFLTKGYILYCFFYDTRSREAHQRGLRCKGGFLPGFYLLCRLMQVLILTTAFRLSPSCFAFQNCFKIMHFSCTSPTLICYTCFQHISEQDKLKTEKHEFLPCSSKGTPINCYSHVWEYSNKNQR